MKKQNKYKDDDGRVIAPMNVEGMPWYRKGPSDTDSKNKEPLTKKETLVVAFNAIFAGLLVALVVVACLFLFILFCIHIWFR